MICEAIRRSNTGTSISGGLRWQASTNDKVNISVDVAFTKGNNAVYGYVGEAF